MPIDAAARKKPSARYVVDGTTRTALVTTTIMPRCCSRVFIVTTDTQHAPGTDHLNNSSVITVSEKARSLVLDARSDEPDGETLALWLEISGVNGDSYVYDMYFQAISDAGEDDAVQDAEGLTIVIPDASVSKLQGAKLDLSGEGEDEGMVIINPNRPQSMPVRSAGGTGEPGRPSSLDGEAEPDLTSDVARRILAVLEQDINPNIAAHGGRADLVAVDGGTAYLRLSGGCQGCGLARVTLSQGIEVALRDAVPEVTSVMDVTDHPLGENPYYEPAKK
jgi:Fe/S biogenesis protein NfuA